MMENRFRKARESRSYSTRDMAEQFHVDISTITSWERGTRKIPVDKLIQMADILMYSTDYLLGYDQQLVALTEPVPPEKLILMHERPVWLSSCGWALVNIAQKCLMLPDGNKLSLEGIDEPIFSFPPAFALSLYGIGLPLQRKDISQYETIWVEPITIDVDFSVELRGWYHVQDRYVRNEFGCCFYFDFYGVKWLAFENCLPTP